MNIAAEQTVANDNMADENESELQKKYELSEKNLRCIKTLSFKAIEDYDKLQKMYNENQNQYEALKERLQDTEAKLNKLQNVLGPACEEYNQLNRNLEIEAACRTEAEKMAAKANKENKKLKRQSQELLMKLGGGEKIELKILETITDESEENETSGESNASLLESQQNALTNKINALESEITSLRGRLQTSETEKETAKKREAELTIKMKKLEAELLKSCQKLRDHEQMVENFKRSSCLALGEFSQLQDKYDQQIHLNHEAENFAHKMLIERDVMVRQSSILMNSAAADVRVMQALIEIENLTKELETLKKDDQDKIKTMEERLSSSGEVKKISSFETELEIASSEIGRLNRAIEEMEEWKQNTIKEMDEVRAKLEFAEDRLRPPPPPPPPPPPTPFLGPKLLVMKSNQSSSSSENSDPSMPKPVTKEMQLNNAMQEMMERIKSGKLTTPKTERTFSGKGPVKAETPKAMLELQNVLKSISSKRSENVGGSTIIDSRKPSVKVPVSPSVEREPPTIDIRRPSKRSVPPPTVLPKPSSRSIVGKQSPTDSTTSPEESELRKKFSTISQRKEKSPPDENLATTTAPDEDAAG